MIDEDVSFHIYTRFIRLDKRFFGEKAFFLDLFLNVLMNCHVAYAATVFNASRREIWPSASTVMIIDVG